MTKMYTICLRCGNVQIRTDINETMIDKYIILEKERKCPKCHIKTKHVATLNIDKLRKELEDNPNRNIDGYLLKLIKK